MMLKGPSERGLFLQMSHHHLESSWKMKELPEGLRQGNVVLFLKRGRSISQKYKPIINFMLKPKNIFKKVIRILFVST